MKHSPGPWKAVKEVGALVIYSDDYDIIGVIDTGNDRDRANAQLIAAAPTLYEFVITKAQEGDLSAKKLLKTLDL